MEKPLSGEVKLGALPVQIRVGLVDDHRVVRHGLQRLLEACDDLRVVGTASSGEEALENFQEWQADVVIMDLLLPGGLDGIETTRRVKTKIPGHSSDSPDRLHGRRASNCRFKGGSDRLCA